MSTPPKRPEHMKCANCLAFDEWGVGTGAGECHREAPGHDDRGVVRWPTTSADRWCLAYIPDLRTCALAKQPTQGVQ